MNSSNSHDAQVYAGNAIDQPAQIEIIPHMDHKLYKAASEGKFDAFNNLVEDLNLLLTPNKNTILHVYITSQTKSTKSLDPKMLMKQFRRIRYQFLEKILNKCPSLLIQVNTKGETPLHIAAQYGHYDIVLSLMAHIRAKSQHQDLESGAAATRETLRMTNMEKDTALHEAARNKHLRVAQILIKEYPDLLNLANDAGETPLYLAAERGHHNLVFEILKTCNSAEAYNGPNGRTALHAAVINKDAEMIKKILQRNVSLAEKTDQQGWTPLHHAAYFNVLPIVKLLLISDKSAAYIRDVEGRTPLLVTVARRLEHRFPMRIQVELIKIILSRCPDCGEIVDGKGRNILHLAVESFNIEGIRALLQNSFLSNLINEKDNEGNTPLHLLADVGLTSKELVNHHLVDKKAVNNQNLTAIDSIFKSDFDAFKTKVALGRSMWKAGHRPSWRSTIQDEPTSKMRERVDFMILEYKKAKDAHLIVATLIATVTFAAGFTLPGGYNSNEVAADQGNAILSKKAAFQAFLITDSIAVALSISVVLIHLLLAMQGNNRRFYLFFKLALYLILVAMGSMVVAFTTGIYAALPHSSALGIVICIITGSLFMFCFFILYGSFPHSQIKAGDSVIIFR